MSWDVVRVVNVGIFFIYLFPSRNLWNYMTIYITASWADKKHSTPVFVMIICIQKIKNTHREHFVTCVRLIGCYEVVAFWLIEDGVCCQQKSIKAAMDAPEILPSDFAKFERPAQLHIAFLALSHYCKKHGALPKPRCQVSPSQSISVCLWSVFLLVLF